MVLVDQGAALPFGLNYCLIVAALPVDASVRDG